MQTTRQTFDIHASDSSVIPFVLELQEYKANDHYATNLEFTGYTNWFGSINLSNMIASEGTSIFCQECHYVLELGCGLGRAGIVAAKTIHVSSNKSRQYKLFLTDAQQAMVDIARQNAVRNNIDCNDEHINVQFRQLQWGNKEHIDQFVQETVDNGGFDVILGADLIYGSNSEQQTRQLIRTVKSLLRRTGVFYLAFTRRDYAMDEVLQIATGYGLEWRMHADYTFDVFDNNVDSDSMFWRDAIFIFTHKKDNENRQEQEGSTKQRIWNNG